MMQRRVCIAFTYIYLTNARQDYDDYEWRTYLSRTLSELACQVE